ncbi:response regulator [Patescibacteria group bacterium]|jgi:DNA-binding response OmpR family regulator|nr:response regulator [Patescibacteria group bacterium]
MEGKPVVLMVEDDMVLRNIAGNILSKYFDATAALNGASARSFLKQRRPDAFLIDIMLPDTSGFDLLAEWRAIEEYDESAMIMFTNLSESADRKRAMDLGADGYYVKADIDISDLPDIINRHIKKRRGKGGWFG